MSYFLHDYLDVFQPFAVPALMSPACMRTIADTARPLLRVDGGGFECRLGDDAPHADFAVRLSKRDLVELPALAEVDEAQRPIWTKVHALAQDWQRPGSPIGESATKLWLEYDIPDSDSGPPRPAPSVFVGLGKVTQKSRACAGASLDLLLDGVARTRAQAWVERCFDALPTSARVAFVGVLLPRARRLVNLNFIALPNEGIVPLLAAVGWPPEGLEAVAALTAELGAHCDRLALSLSFDPQAEDAEGEGQVVGRIGLECFVDRPDSLPVWANMLDHFVATGLCTEQKREATLAWAGVSVVDPHGPDPSNLAKVLAVLGDQLVGAFTRRINHLKLSYTPGARPKLKAYFDFGHVIARRRPPAAAAADKTSTPPAPSPAAYVESVRDYYDRFARSIVETVGTTYQAGMLTPGPERSYAASNLDLARRAGVEAGMSVLDGGCGSCGPAVDIARAIPDLSIDAITLSREQAKLGREAVEAAGLAAQIHVHVGDYHDLPFPDASYERALFFETLGYAYDLRRLFAGVHRVLRDGGCVYIKDTFVLEGPLSPKAQRDLADHDARYVYRTPRMSELVSALERAGFVIERAAPLPSISTQAYDAALAQRGQGPDATAFAQHHHYDIVGALPIYFGELRARK